MVNKKGMKIITEWLWPDPAKAGIQGMVGLPMDYNTIHREIIPRLQQEGAEMGFDSKHSDHWHIYTAEEIWEGKQPYLVLLQYILGRQDNET